MILYRYLSGCSSWSPSSCCSCCGDDLQKGLSTSFQMGSGWNLAGFLEARVK